jgi:glycosyltransferase involved in cell wall biosynthesis
MPHSSPATVLFVESSPTPAVGGSHHSLLQLVRGLDRARYRPVVAFSSDNPLLASFREAGAAVHVLGGGGARARGRVALGIGAAREAAALLGVARREGAALVHANDGVSTNRAAIAAAALARRPCVCHERKLRAYTRPDRVAARRIEVLIAISDAVRERVRGAALPVRGLVRIHNALDPESVRPAEPAGAVRRRLGVPAGAPVAAIVGRLVEWKGQEVAIRALHLLRGSHPELRLLVVGEAPPGSAAYAERLRRVAAELGVAERVVFAGFAPHPAELLAAADVLVHASTSPEPFGRVLLEAMALARPVVATAAGGAPEVVEDGVTGVLAPPGDAAALAGALRRLLDDPAAAARMGRAGRERLRAEFSLEAHVRRVQGVYRLLGVGRGGTTRRREEG